MLTLSDLFCGAGGSSTGATMARGVEVRVASNHWQLAVETHNTNHPDADHICADLSQIHPRYFPRTDVLWASPECTNHSVAKGKPRATMQDSLIDERPLPDEAAERSRATMWDVVRFTEHHKYAAILVENVVEVTEWLPFKAWLMAMHALGYDHRIISLNSMHAQAHGLPAPQSRDRVYVAFWRKGDAPPDFDDMQRPEAWCPSCGEVVRSVQTWKNGRTVGRYGRQYYYRCPKHGCRGQKVEPAWLPAASIIDWSLPATRIGDRAKPLADKTRARIAAGIARYWSAIHLEAAGNTYDAADPKHPQHGDPGAYYRAWPISDPLRTIHTWESKALAIPVEGRDGKQAQPVSQPLRTQTTRLETALAFIAELRGGSSDARAITDPLSTITAGGNHHGLVMTYYGQGGVTPTSDPLATLTTVERHALLMRNNTGGAEMTTPVSEPARTITTAAHQSLLMGQTVDVDDVLFRMLEPSEAKRAMAFPTDYVILGNRREQVRMAGNAVTPPAARDLITTVAHTLHN